VLGILFALGKPSAARQLRFVLSGSLLTTSILGLLALGSSGRESLRMSALFLPLWAGWLYGAWLASRAPRAPQPMAEAGGGGALLGGRAVEAVLPDAAANGGLSSG
jgi:hypothetical protein